LALTLTLIVLFRYRAVVYANVPRSVNHRTKFRRFPAAPWYPH